MIAFLNNNLVQSGVLSADTENAQFPLSNLKNDFRTKVYRSTANTAVITIDMGSMEEANSLALVDNWQEGFGFTSVQVQGNMTDEWSSPALDVLMPVSQIDNKHGFAYVDFSTVNLRFYRVLFTSTLGYVEVASLHLGKKLEITTNGQQYDWSYTDRDLKRTQTTRYGQEYFDLFGRRKELRNISFDAMNKDEMAQLYDLFDINGTTKPFIYYFCDQNGLVVDDADRFNGLYKLTSNPTVTNFSAGFYRTSLNLREQK